MPKTHKGKTLLAYMDAVKIALNRVPNTTLQGRPLNLKNTYELAAEWYVQLGAAGELVDLLEESLVRMKCGMKDEQLIQRLEEFLGHN